MSSAPARSEEVIAMKLGFVSAILDGWNFEGMIDTAAEMGYQCV